MRLIVLALAAVLALTGCQSEPANEPTPGQPSIPFDKEGTLAFYRGSDTLLSIDIEIAETDSARERGLMQRASLPDRSGMLFIFDREEPQSFWMANTPLALDIMFVNADSEIVHVAKYTRPLSPHSVASTRPARFVIETPAGFADTHGITESDRVRWERLDGE